MALGEEKAELEAHGNTKAQGPEPEQLPCPEAEGGPASPLCRTKELPALACWAEADPSGTSGIYLPQASVASRVVEADGPTPALSNLFPPAITGSGDFSAGSQVEEIRLPASQGLPQIINTPRTAAPCSGHDADTGGDSSPADSPQVLGLSQQPLISGVSFLSQRKSMTFCCQLEKLIHWLYNVTDVTDLGTPPRSSLTGLKSSLQLYRQFKRDIHEHQSLTDSVLEKGETLLQCLLDNTPVLKDVLGRISKQSGELESHADRLYDSILASLDMLAGCSLIPDSKPVAAMEPPCAGV
ncbi:centrosomal protein of 68 kDa isoform X2 [Octodon degus]|uniref:Centrosomal protein of 68 kDa n=1 Tax=Octodon degus TaxID=10160 RepID=A0A6P6EW96_OCTDE|nr:centrosomal protein of 68 kDa isoform X2 [Octodon degus]